MKKNYLILMLLFVLITILIFSCDLFTQIEENVEEDDDLIKAYSTDFTLNPGWATDDVSRFYWSSVNQNYYLSPINIDGGGNYAIKDTAKNMTSRSFQLEYDIIVTNIDYACGIQVGLFDTDMNFNETGSFVWVIFCREDRGYQVLLGSMNSSNTSMGDWTEGTDYSLDIWYQVVISYNASSGQLSANVKNRTTGIILRTFSIISGPFSFDMDRIGLSTIRTGNYQVPGADAQCYIDNVVFYISRN